MRCAQEHKNEKKNHEDAPDEFKLPWSRNQYAEEDHTELFAGFEESSNEVLVYLHKVRMENFEEVTHPLPYYYTSCDLNP